MNHNYNSTQNVPSIREIQEILVEMQDKPESFLGSKQWIGSFEVAILCYVYSVPIITKKNDRRCYQVFS